MSRFAEWLTYKAQKAGKKVITIDEAYTTQICPKCGKKEKKQLNQRQLLCSNCELSLDRDLASAINHLTKFLILREQCQWDQHLSGFIDVRKLKLEEALEATFDYLGENVETCIAELTAYGMIHDSNFQEPMNSFYKG